MPSPVPLTDSLINDAMINAVKAVYSTMLRVDVVLIDRVSNIEPAAPDAKMQIIGNVGFGGSINGLVYFAMTEELAFTVAGKILQMDPHELASHGPEAITDAIGEIANMSVGSFKNRLCDLGYPCMLTLPSMVRARGLSVKGIRDTTRYVYHFDCLGERVTADLHMRVG